MASQPVESPDEDELAAHVEEVAGSDVVRVLRDFPVFDSGCDESAARDEDHLHGYGFGEWRSATLAA